jgi:hypothetical protein
VEQWIGKDGSFTAKYNVHNLIWWHSTKYVLNAIALEKEIKDWTRAKKEALIEEMNPEWKFMNVEMLGNWPPTDEQIEEAKARWREEQRLKNIQPLSFLRQLV